MNILNSVVCNLKRVSPMKLCVRCYEKRHYIRRYGYKEKLLFRGTLPRIKDKEDVSTPYDEYRPKDSWAEKRALFGQNDYIDILGDGNVHPVRLLTNIPVWLRGISGNEFKVQLRRSKFVGEYLSIMRPTKYEHLQKRIRYLYKYLNRKTNLGR